MAPGEGIWQFLAGQGDRLQSFFQRLEHQLAPHDPMVAVIRREGMISEGRYVMFFEVLLFGENPVVLEEFGTPTNREIHATPRLSQQMVTAVSPYRYFTEIRQRFKTVEEAAQFWNERGATVLWDD